MDHKARTLKELEEKSAQLTSKRALLGFDGFVDTIVHPVESRTGKGNQFSSMKSLTDLGQKIIQAAGKSTNIEIYPMMEKIGGNGPIMGGALIASGLETHYIGSLGYPIVHPVLKDFAEKSNAISIAEPGITHAIECSDGKVMLVKMQSMETITWEKIIDVVGEGILIDQVARADLFAMLNWTMLPDMTKIMNAILEKILPHYGPKEGRIFYFDLADPDKRTLGDLQGALNTISKFRSYGRTILGLNLKEAEQVYAALGHKPAEHTADGLKLMANRIRKNMHIQCVVIHPVDGAACATKDNTYYVKGPHCMNPKITTGAGDHFNAGFAIGQLLNMSEVGSLMLAVSYSGYYVRTAESPTLSDVDSFIRNWD